MGRAEVCGDRIAEVIVFSLCDRRRCFAENALIPKRVSGEDARSQKTEAETRKTMSWHMSNAG